MRTPSSAVAGWFVVCGNEDMEPPGVIERQKNIIVDDLSAVSFLSSSNSVTDGGNDNNTSLSNSTNSSDAVNSVADFILKLQQTSSHHNSSDPPGQDLTNNKSARLSGSALDIAALRKSLTGRPRLQRICHICGRECPSRHKLQRHLSTHSEERPYNCSLCGKAFKWTEYLSKHMRTQHGPNNSTGSKNFVSIRKQSTRSPTRSTNSVEPCSPKVRAYRRSTSDGRSSSVSSSTSSVMNGLQDNKIYEQLSRDEEQSISKENRAFMKRNEENSTSETSFSPQNETHRDYMDVSISQPSMMHASTPPNMMTDPYHFQYNQYPTSSFPIAHSGFYPMNCYTTTYPANANPFGFPGPQPFTNNLLQNISFDPTMQNYMSESHITHDLDIGTSFLSSDTPVFDPPNTHSSSTSVSCQTQESSDPANNPRGLLQKRPTVRIINLSTKKDVKIQCDLGPETLQALFDEESYGELSSSLSPDMYDTQGDEGSNCLCKYPCEFTGCTRAYVHRKDLTRHMKVAHGITPKVMEPRIIEAPAKPHVCHVGDCGKSYYHLKDLRRHQRQCHSVSLSPASQSSQGEMDDSISSMRYPCDLDGCVKSYIHKKDLIRHKRMFHHDMSSHPNIPDPVIVIHVKKTKGAGEERMNECGEKQPKRFRLDSLAEPKNGATLPTTSNLPHTPGIDEIDEMSVSATNVMNNFSIAVANMAGVEELSPHMRNTTALSTFLDSIGPDSSKETDSSSNEFLMEGNSLGSPTSFFTSSSLLTDASSLLSSS